MYTEDDTFRVLRKTPFDELRPLVKQYLTGKRRLIAKHYADFIKKHGWDLDEYQRASSKWYAEHNKP